MVLRELNRFLFEATSPNEIWEKHYSGHITYDKFVSLASFDPTSKFNDAGKLVKTGKYIKWIYKMYVRRLLSIDDYDLKQRVSDDIEFFHKNKRLFRNSDIQKYDIYELDTEAQELMKGPVQQTSRQKKREGKLKGAKKIYEDQNLLVVSPKTEEAACLYGANTKWCTAATRTINHFEGYNKRSPLFIFIYQNGRKYQLHFDSGDALKDETDTEVIPFSSAFPEDEKTRNIVSKNILDHYMTRLSNDPNIKYLLDSTPHIGAAERIEADNIFEALQLSRVTLEYMENRVLNRIVDIAASSSAPDINDKYIFMAESAKAAREFLELAGYIIEMPDGSPYSKVIIKAGGQIEDGELNSPREEYLEGNYFKSLAGMLALSQGDYDDDGEIYLTGRDVNQGFVATATKTGNKEMAAPEQREVKS